MGHSRRGSLVHQVEEALRARLAIGQSKHADKAAGVASQRVYSWETFRDYLRHGCYFVKYCRDIYGCKTLADCRSHAAEWIDVQAARGLSPYTLKLEAAALGKIYGVSSADLGIVTPTRSRAAITRSRGKAARDRHFSEARHANLVEFCRCTGLRRGELQALRGPVSLSKNEAGDWSMNVTAGTKGGRPRSVPIVGTPEAVEAVIRRLQATPEGERVWPKLPNGADIHAYRADYATRVYNKHARPLAVCKASRWGRGSAVYWCRGDRKGTWFDKAAMYEASRALGHNRIEVVGEHYIRP